MIVSIVLPHTGSDLSPNFVQLHLLSDHIDSWIKKFTSALDCILVIWLIVTDTRRMNDVYLVSKFLKTKNYVHIFFPGNLLLITFHAILWCDLKHIFPYVLCKTWYLKFEIESDKKFYIICYMKSSSLVNEQTIFKACHVGFNYNICVFWVGWIKLILLLVISLHPFSL